MDEEENGTGLPFQAKRSRSTSLMRTRNNRNRSASVSKGATITEILRETKEEGEVALPRSLRDVEFDGTSDEADEGDKEVLHRLNNVSDDVDVSGSLNVADKLLFTHIRSLVSKKKRRFKSGNFNLDLSYITDKVVAMGFPSEEAEGLYRNPLDEVVRLFESRHANHYRVYNLCAEPQRKYNHNKFPTGEVIEVGFYDHNPPPFSLISQFCQDATHWLNSNHNNIVVTHCKAGKGRTGTLIACLFLHSGEFETAADALAYFALMRTVNNKGVTIASQRRYVHYYERREQVNWQSPPTKAITTITFAPVPKLASLPCKPFFVVVNGDKEYDSREITTTQQFTRSDEQVVISFPPGQGIAVTGDFKVLVKHEQSRDNEDKMFHFWLHTAFVSPKEVLTKTQLDGGAKKDKRHNTYAKDFRVEISFEEETGNL